MRREHGFAGEPRYVLVQGRASYDASPDPAVLAERVRPASERFMRAPRSGWFWDRWLAAYYADRALVTVQVERVVSWPDLTCTGKSSVAGAPLPEREPALQVVPKNGTGPRVEVQRAARRLRKLPHVLLGYVDADGYPIVLPAEAGPAGAAIALAGPALPPGGRRAGVMAHRYEAQLIGLEMRQHTGWLADGLYAPHTESGFRAPANKTLLLLANGYMARRGLKRARAEATRAAGAGPAAAGG